MELFYYYRVLFMLSVIIALNSVNGQNRLAYRIPQPTAAVLTPRGFRISIPGTNQKPKWNETKQTTVRYMTHTHIHIQQQQTKTIFKYILKCTLIRCSGRIEGILLRIHCVYVSIYCMVFPGKNSITQTHTQTKKRAELLQQTNKRLDEKE